MKGTTTVSVASSRRADDDEDSREIPTLMLAWSAEEPWRAGEVAFAGSLGEPFILGRGDDDNPTERMRFFRQRPQKMEETPPLEGRALSRRQLIVKRFAGGLEVERVGRCPLFVNGAPVDRAAVIPGSVLRLRGQLVLYCSARPYRLPPARHFPEAAWGPFGERDALGMLGESPAIWKLRDQLAFAAKSGSHVLLHGDSGTGKELAARAIHQLSGRASKTLVSRNAATFPSGLIDAELFGNVKNYPNPGTPERLGLIGQAHGSTLFLDEIAELPHEMQAHLLRVLDEGGEYQRLGEATHRTSDFRLIGATNRPPTSLKHDLLARLAGRVELAPLGERREDIPLLVRHLVLRAAEKSPETAERFVARTAGRNDARVEGTLIEALLRRAFATNVRELDGLLWQAMGASPADTVVLTDSADGRGDPPRPQRSPDREPTPDEVRDSILRAGGNILRAAEGLGVSRYALYRLMRKHGIDPRGDLGT